jgi:hypothetical protein
MANGDSDVKLVPGQVRVEAWDLCLDAGKERRKNDSTHRRALVHDYGDGLTINYEGDYPEGVTINGNNVLVVGKLLISPRIFPPPPPPETKPPPGGLTTERPSGETAKAKIPQEKIEAMALHAILRSYLGSGPIDVFDALTKAFAELNTVKEQLKKVEEKLNK